MRETTESRVSRAAIQVDDADDDLVFDPSPDAWHDESVHIAAAVYPVQAITLGGA